MEEHFRILEMAARNALPERVDEDSELSVLVIRELYEAGYLDAADACSRDGMEYLDPRITLQGREYLRQLQSQRAAPDKELIANLERMRDMMVSVSTGGPQIQMVNEEYRELYTTTDEALVKRGIANPIPFPDLWDWYGRWKSGELTTYQSRRQFLADMFNPLLKQVREYASGRPPLVHEPTGWPRVDRTVGEIRRRLIEAKTEEQFQAIGHQCREVIISLAQAVYDPNIYPSTDGIQPSETDAKRMLGAYIDVELAGSSNQLARKYAHTAFDLANELQHRRTATFRQAALCTEATGSLINVIAIVSGRRDPST